MPRFLYLMRHAQSADKQVGFSDKERELTPKGIREAIQIGVQMVKEKYFPELIVSSSAIRSKTTAGLVLDAIKLTPEKIQVDEELYVASVRTFLELVTQFDNTLQQVMCVGHNPTISYLAEYLTKAEIGDIPPAGLVVIQFNTGRWQDVGEGSGEFIRLILPEV
jgi:phosphohistidine phosphatase